MAKTIEQLKAQGAQVKNATVVGENTATRVGTLFTDIVEHVEQYEAGQTADTEANTLAINQEAQARAKADEQLSTAIVTEKNRAEAAEQANATAIETETARAKAAEEANATAIANTFYKATERAGTLSESNQFDLNELPVGTAYSVGGGSLEYMLNKPLDLTNVNVIVTTSKSKYSDTKTSGIFQTLFNPTTGEYWMRACWGSDSTWLGWTKIAGPNSVTTNRIADEAVTIPKLSSNIQALITNLSKTATFAGIASPTTNPDTPNEPIFYFATQEGTYSNFNNIEIKEGEAAILRWNNRVWTKEISGFATASKLLNIELNNNSIALNTILDNGYSKYILSDGITLSESPINNLRGYTRLIIAKAGIVIRNLYAIKNAAYKYLWFYDKNLNVVGYLQGESGMYYDAILTSNNIPQGAIYCRGNFSKEKMPTINDTEAIIYTRFEDLINDTELKEKIVQQTNGLVNALYDVKQYTSADMQKDAYYATHLDIVPNNPILYTPNTTTALETIEISVKKGSAIIVKSIGGNNGRAYALTDENKNVYLRAEPLQDCSAGVTITTKKDGFLYVTNNYLKLEKCEIQIQDSKIEETKQEIENLKNNDISTDALKDIIYFSDEIKYLNKSQSMASIIHSWGFIGGSTSSGEFEYTENGTTKYVDEYDYSIGQRFCILNGVNGYNFSRGGQYAKAWCQESGDRAWAGAQKTENLKHAYVIDLGANDMRYYQAGNLETDIDFADYNNNADTFAGWIVGLVQRLRSVNPKCYIFFYTSRNYMYPNNSDYATKALPVIRQLPEFLKGRFEYDRIYLADNAMYGAQYSNIYRDVLLNGGHPSVIGYQYEAFVMNTLIDNIIRKNYSDFKEAMFVLNDRHRE